MNDKHIGSRFNDFLAELAILEETTATAIKPVIAWQISEEMKQQNLTEADMVERMHTSRSAFNRLLDEEDTSLTLTTLANAAAVFGKTVRIELVAAAENEIG
jgi:antitoxin HicB